MTKLTTTEKQFAEQVMEEVWRDSQADSADPIVKVRRADGETVYCAASKFTPDDDVLPGQRTTTRQEDRR